MDYAFKFPEEAESDLPLVLVAHDHHAGAIWVSEVDHKVVEAGVGTSCRVRKFEMASYSGIKMILKSDQELSILKLKQAVAIQRHAVTALIESLIRA